MTSTTNCGRSVPIRTAVAAAKLSCRCTPRRLTVSKQVVTKGRLRVSLVTRQRDELVDSLLAREHIEIERTPIGRPVETMPAIREEGDTLVIPVVEEVLITERRLVLKEEVRIRKRRETERHQERVVLRRQEATITRLPTEKSAAGEGD